VQTVHDLNSLQSAIAAFRAAGDTVALVPTMGALHAGHIALVKLAQAHARRVIVSIFVNPKQFGAHEDLASYPRTLATDRAQLIAAGADLLWAPSASEMYPAGYATTVSVAGLGDHLCGAARPGHFDGVATVVTKLFTQIKPDSAVFGEKDWQQLAIIRRLEADLNLGVTLIGAPIVREADGLAMSSRNAYLTPRERAIAAAFPKALLRAADQILTGVDLVTALNAAKASILAAGFASIDYIALCDPDTLEILSAFNGHGRIIAAARLGKTRLIDNMPIVARK
jgi:pantoate--beta-alanine ligase